MIKFSQVINRHRNVRMKQHYPSSLAFLDKYSAAHVKQYFEEHAVLSIHETRYRYHVKLSTENDEIADWLLQLSTTQNLWSFGLCFFRSSQHQRLWMEP